MKKLLKAIGTMMIGILPLHCFGGGKPAGAHSTKPLYDYSYTAMNGSAVKMSVYKGKKILIVNVASKCGFTPQYEALEKLATQFKDKLTVVGFPANNFMGQEPGTNEEIATFCSSTYGVTFPMAQKISVIGDDRHEIYKWLTDKRLNGWNDLAPKWNFYKYLIDENGELLQVFPSTTTPLSKDITNLLH
jgi:glutathione peroxidase